MCVPPLTFLSFYESLGFEVIGRKVDYPSAGRTALRMTRLVAAGGAHTSAS